VVRHKRKHINWGWVENARGGIQYTGRGLKGAVKGEKALENIRKNGQYKKEGIFINTQNE